MPTKPKTKSIPTAEAIAVRADRGEDVSAHFTNKGRMVVPQPIQRVNVDFAAPMLAELDQAKACTIFTKSDAERVFHAPVVHVETEMDKTDCAWGLMKNPRAGVLVSRGSRSDWYPPRSGTTGVSKIHHVTGVGEDAYTYYANAGAGGLYTADVLTSKGVTEVVLAGSR